MDRLWSPWRLEYIAGGKPKAACIFCEATGETESSSLIVFKGDTCYVILNLYPYNNGHVMVVPYRHVATFRELSVEELTEIGVLIQRAEAALSEAYQPHGFNVGLNMGRVAGAGIPDHLHVHVVPRWNGDANFISVIGQTRVLPEALGTTFDRLKAALSS